MGHRSTIRALLLMMLAGAAVSVWAQSVPSTVHPLHRPLDELLDLYVRDGYVYYRALRADRGRLDRYIASLADSPAALALSKGSAEEQKAFWINAYNALVLRTVIDRFPIRGRSPEYPPDSIRQIPGAFEKPAHRVAGRMVSLDAIEREILAGLGDARVFFALGRGARGGGRLRSEAFDAPKVEAQLAAVAEEMALRQQVVKIDELAGVLSVSPIFSWRESVFVAGYADKAPAVYAQRSPIERAVAAFLEPNLPTPERLFLQRNTFRMEFQPFDWRLNDFDTRP